VHEPGKGGSGIEVAGPGAFDGERVDGGGGGFRSDADLPGAGAFWPAAVADPETEIGCAGGIETEGETQADGGALDSAPGAGEVGDGVGEELVAGGGGGWLDDSQIVLRAIGKCGDGPGDGIAGMAEAMVGGAFETEAANLFGKVQGIAGLDAEERVGGPGPGHRVRTAIDEGVCEVEAPAGGGGTDGGGADELQRKAEALAAEGEGVWGLGDDLPGNAPEVAVVWNGDWEVGGAGLCGDGAGGDGGETFIPAGGVACIEWRLAGARGAGRERRLKKRVAVCGDGGDLAAEGWQEGDGAVSCCDDNVFFVARHSALLNFCYASLKLCFDCSACGLTEPIPDGVEPCSVLRFHEHGSQAGKRRILTRLRGIENRSRQLY